MYTGICDDKCCCDTSCPGSYIQAWKAQNLCSNQEFIYSQSSINLCSKKKPKTIDDLRSGLRIYYQILKIFFCVAVDNSKMSDRFKDFQTGEDLASAITNTQPSSSSSASANTLQVASTVSSTNVWEDYKVPRPSFGSSLCNNKLITFNNNMELRDCFLKPSTLSSICAAGSSIDPSVFATAITFRGTTSTSSTATLTVRNITIKASTTLGYSAGTISNLIAPTAATDTTDSTLCTCSNFISQVNYQLVVDSDNRITSGYVDLVITPSQTFTCANPLIKYSTSLFFVNQQIDVPRLKGPGYRFGDPILIGSSTENSTTGLSIITAYAEPPLSLNYLNNDGDCALVNVEIDPKSYKRIEFGSNQIFSCSRSMTLAELNTFCTSSTAGPRQVQMYQNIENNFKFLAKFANSDPSLISDWASAGSYTSATGTYTSGTKTCTLNVPRISIFYSAIGTQMNPGYKINSVTIAQTSERLIFTQSSDTTAQVFNFPLYVNFVPLPQSPSYFVAPAPTVNVKLPDNVLTPFIRSRN